MSFTTDQQTLEDLNIFGKYGSDSLFGLFNHCATRGGAKVLEEMFKYPLSSEEAISRRSEIFRYFSDHQVPLPFNITNFDAAERYLSNTDARSRLDAQEYSTVKRLSNLVAKAGEILMIENGISAISMMLYQLRVLIIQLNVNLEHPYGLETQRIVKLLEEPAFASIFTIGAQNKLTNEMMVNLDDIFRFKKRETVQELLNHIYQLDVYLSVARISQEHGFVFAKALSSGKLSVALDGLYHPMVNNAVSTSLQVEPSGNIIFLTGANMAGKSTFMKSLSIALFLAHMGFPVAARRMEFSVLDGIYTTINLPDNLGIGASHFYAEVLRVKKMAIELQRSKNLFILFDELFRGTNVKDAYEATIAIIQAFSKKQQSLFVISTHIIEAGEVLKETCSNVRFKYLPTRMEGNKPLFTYKLEDGITNDRHGMIIINNEGILEILKSGLKKNTVQQIGIHHASKRKS